MTIGRPGRPGSPGGLPPISGENTGSGGGGKDTSEKKLRKRDSHLPNIDHEPLTAVQARDKFRDVLLPSINPSSTNKRVERMIKRYSNQDPVRQKQCFKKMENDNFSPEERQAVLKALGLSKNNNFVDSLRKRVGSNSSDGETTVPTDTSRSNSPSSDSPSSRTSDTGLRVEDYDQNAP